MPLGDTSFRAILRAISFAEPVNVPGGGNVDSVFTVRTHFRVAARLAILLPVDAQIVMNVANAGDVRHHVLGVMLFAAAVNGP